MAMFGEFRQQDLKRRSVKFFSLLSCDIFVNETFPQTKWNRQPYVAGPLRGVGDANNQISLNNCFHKFRLIRQSQTEIWFINMIDHLNIFSPSYGIYIRYMIIWCGTIRLLQNSKLMSWENWTVRNVFWMREHCISTRSERGLRQSPWRLWLIPELCGRADLISATSLCKKQWMSAGTAVEESVSSCAPAAASGSFHFVQTS